MSQNIIILCTGNSCRSQMAQVIWQEMAGNLATVFSAGSEPAGYVHPLAIKALEEMALPTSGLKSKSINPFLDQPIDIAVTVCDHAQQACPAMPLAKKTLHWPFDDPAEATGTDEEKMIVFRRVRDEIKARIKSYINNPLESPNADNV